MGKVFFILISSVLVMFLVFAVSALWLLPKAMQANNSFGDGRMTTLWLFGTIASAIVLAKVISVLPFQLYERHKRRIIERHHRIQYALGVSIKRWEEIENWRLS